MRQKSPSVLRATVLPPALGPVITSSGRSPPTRRSMGTTGRSGACHACASRSGLRAALTIAPGSSPTPGAGWCLWPLPRLRQQERVARAHDGRPAFLADRGLGRLHGLRELGAREDE